VGHVPELDELCQRQQGVLTRQQAVHHGMTLEQIRSHLRSGRWQRLYAGVYATFSGPVPRMAQLWAAVLYAGPDTALSHQSAAELAGLAEAGGPIHVSVPSGRRIRRPPGVVVHLSSRVETARHPTRLPPQTRVEETILDLTQTAPNLDRALSWVVRACASRLTTVDRLTVALGQRKKMHRRAELCAVLQDVRRGCHSMLELRCLRDVERPHGLPTALRQRVRARPGGQWYDDVHYPEYAIVVELDGRVAHPDDQRWRDMRRDNAEVVAGGRVLRYGVADVLESPCAVATQVALLLRRHGWTATPRACSNHCMIAKGKWGQDPT
jgi:hypothetical protein